MYGVAGQKRISEEFVKSYPVSLPSLDDQRRIAGYLEAETTRIDALIAELAEMVALVRDRSHERQSELAGRGVDGSDLVPSGYAWLGDVPAHWRVTRLKYEARLESGHTPSRSRPDLWVDCSIPWVSLNDVGAMASTEFLFSTVNLINEQGLAASSARVLPAGTVIVSRDATIGRTAILGKAMATSQHFADWICGSNLDPRYLWLVFRTAMEPHFHSLTDGATLRTIGMPDMRQLVVPVPPLTEQREIVRLSEQERENEAERRSEIENQMTLLRERRQAIITHAVTEGLDSLKGAA